MIILRQSLCAPPASLQGLKRHSSMHDSDVPDVLACLEHLSRACSICPGNLAYLGLPVGPKKALQYARLHLAPFQHQHLQEVQKLMACLVFVKRPRERNPYSHLLEPGQRDAVARDFARQCCGLLGLVSRCAQSFLGV